MVAVCVFLKRLWNCRYRRPHKHTQTSIYIHTLAHKLFAAYQRVGRCPFLWAFCFVFVCFSYSAGGGWKVGGRDVTRMADGPQSTYTHTQTRQIHRYKKWGSLGTTHLSFSVRRAARTSLENCLSSFLPSLFFLALSALFYSVSLPVRCLWPPLHLGLWPSTMAQNIRTGWEIDCSAHVSYKTLATENYQQLTTNMFTPKCSDVICRLVKPETCFVNKVFKSSSCEVAIRHLPSDKTKYIEL